MPTLLARLRFPLALLLALLVIPASGCDSAEPDVPNIAGPWSGTSNFGGHGFSTRMELEQRGRSISGTADLPSRRGVVIEGEVDAFDRFVWTVQIGCEQWSGSLDIDEAVEVLSGSINRDAASCPGSGGSNGTLRLFR